MEIDNKWDEFLYNITNNDDNNNNAISVYSESDEEEEDALIYGLKENEEEEREKNEEDKINDLNSLFSSSILEEDIKNDKTSDLYISTKSKIAYLNNEIDLKELFWNINIIQYNEAKNGIIKKQIKYSCKTEEELLDLQVRLKNIEYYEEKILKNIKNPTGRVKFKDIRKVSVGLSTKDILSFRSKEKGAFYNCLVLIIRYKVKDSFKEFHTKFFNTGKIEIPGIQDDNVYDEILDFILLLLRPLINDSLDYTKKNEIVLINSDFTCGFFINQEALYHILKYKYNIQCIYDPCSYPGLQCKFYYNYISEDMSGHQTNNMTIKENKKSENDVIISFMIFRTGSVLISGKCQEPVIRKVYTFIKNMLIKELPKIFIKENTNNTKNKNKNKKIRKKIIFVKKT
jgi:hypothetical protein